MSRSRRVTRVLVGCALAASVVAPVRATTSIAATLPNGFQEQVVFAGLNRPTNIEFAPDGRVFVAEKRGVIKVFDDLQDVTPTVFADLSTEVHDLHDRGLLGLALPPNFPADPWVYVLYTYDAPPGQTAPYWHDDCGAVGGDAGGQCVVTARLSRLEAAGNVMTGAEDVLIRDWCQQFPSHSIGDLRFGSDGALYASSGDGASYTAVDYGQLGNPVNPCGDPPGGAMSPPTADGGALRSQDVRTTADPTGLDGTVLRLNPDTGAAMPDNPLIGSSDPNARRIVAHGLRNPYRFAIRPGTNEVWLGDVGWGWVEEINRLPDPTAAPRNFGWPCYEGAGHASAYNSADLDTCESLYTAGGASPPYFSWTHASQVVPGEACPSGGSAVTGAAFYPDTGGPYPAQYRGALFFADYARQCIWAMKPTTAGGPPDPGNVETFASGVATPVDLAIGPGNELYYVDINGGTVRVLRYFAGNQPPIASIAADPTSGRAPVAVNFSAAGSTDPDPADRGQLRYEWDFTDDGTVDATGVTASHTYTGTGTYTARLTVRDPLGASGTDTVVITTAGTRPTAVIDTPVAGTTWATGSRISFSGHATDPDQGTLPSSALDWQLRMQHCHAANDCHTHYLEDWSGVSSGSFLAPDHEYPSYLELVLTATDASGLRHTVVRRLDPKTVDVTFRSSPSGLRLTVGPTTETTPFTRTLIQGSTVSVSAPTPQSADGLPAIFNRWSDGGAQSHVIKAPATATTYTATYGCDAFGYACSVGPRTFVPADQTVLTLRGDNSVQQVTLPFPVKLYGHRYSSARVDTNGLISFAGAPPATATNGPLPSVAAPNAALYPFWDDLVVDGSATVRTAVVGTWPRRSFVVEWRDVGLVADPTRRVTFEVVIGEDGRIGYAYRDIADNAGEQGGGATVGLENAGGTVGWQYTFNQPLLRSGTGLTVVPPSPVVPPRRSTPSASTSPRRIQPPG